MTDKEELKKAICTLKDYCASKYNAFTQANPCSTCMFEDCCQNRWSDYDTLEQVMGGLLEDIATNEKVKNTDFGAAYDAVEKLICNNFSECNGCPFFAKEDDCPLGQINSMMTAY